MYRSTSVALRFKGLPFLKEARGLFVGEGTCLQNPDVADCAAHMLEIGLLALLQGEDTGPAMPRASTMFFGRCSGGREDIRSEKSRRWEKSCSA